MSIPIRTLPGVRHAGRIADVLPVRADLAIPCGELRWQFSRAGGPGGQSVNTADSRVELRWDPAASAALCCAMLARAMERLSGRLLGGTLVVTASEHRSQLHNRRAAEVRLVALVVEATQTAAASGQGRLSTACRPANTPCIPTEDRAETM